jgi:hypothetical protein
VRAHGGLGVCTTRARALSRSLTPAFPPPLSPHRSETAAKKGHGAPPSAGPYKGSSKSVLKSSTPRLSKPASGTGITAAHAEVLRAYTSATEDLAKGAKGDAQVIIQRAVDDDTKAVNAKLEHGKATGVSGVAASRAQCVIILPC